MKNNINLLRENDGNKSDLDLVKELYEFLQGNLPDTIKMKERDKIKLSKNKAFTVIRFLQEDLCVLPSSIEQCSECKELFDLDNSGCYKESRGKFYCGACMPCCNGIKCKC